MYPIGTLQTPGIPVFPFDVILECRLARAEDGTSMFVVLWEFEVKPGSEEPLSKSLWTQRSVGPTVSTRSPFSGCSTPAGSLPPARLLHHRLLGFQSCLPALPDEKSRSVPGHRPKHGRAHPARTPHSVFRTTEPFFTLHKHSDQPISGQIRLKNRLRRSSRPQNRFRSQIATSHRSFHCCGPTGIGPISGQEHSSH